MPPQNLTAQFIRQPLAPVAFNQGGAPLMTSIAGLLNEQPPVPQLSVVEKPRFTSPLQLTADREKWLVHEYIIPRIDEVKKEMGLLHDGNVDPKSWMAIRKRNQESYDNNLEWRKALGGVFATGQNFTLGGNRRYARLISARVRNDLISTRPFFGAMTGRTGDPELTKEVEEYLQERIEESNVPEVLRDGLRTALIRNEAVIKTTYLLDESPFVGTAKVLVDAMGRPVQTPLKKLYVYEEDDWIADPTTEGVSRLEKDPSFTMVPGQYRSANVPRLPQRLTHYDGPHAEVIDFRDFLCPLKIADQRRADINVHFFYENPDNLRHLYKDYDVSQRYYQQCAGATGAKKPVEAMGETDEQPSRVLNGRLLADVYVRVDADGDNAAEEVWLLLDVENQMAIWYDYLGNHMSQRPFSVIPGIEKVPGRWYGVGVFTKMEHNGLYIDSQFNRINEKDSQASSVTFRVPHAVKQWKNGAPTVLGTKAIMDCEPGYDATNPPLFRVNLQADAMLDLNLVDRMQQAGDLEFAVISGRDASANSLNQSETATGVLSIERDANAVTKDTEHEHIKAIEQVLDIACEHTLNNMDQMEMRFSTKGQRLVALSREEIRRLPRKVRLLLTKARSAEQLVSNEKAEAVWLRYMGLDPVKQFYGRDFYIQQLKALDVDDADRRLPEVTEDEMKAWVAAQQAAKEPPKPAGTSIGIKYTDLARSEQVQLLARENIRPAAEAEIANMKAEALQLEEAKKPDPDDKPANPSDQS